MAEKVFDSLWQVIESGASMLNDKNLADVCRFVSFAPGEAYGPHSHVRIEINYVQRGSCSLELSDGVVESFDEGEMMIITHDVLHRFVAGAGGCTLMQLEFRSDIFSGIGHFASNDGNGELYLFSNHRPVIKIVDNVRIMHAVRRIIFELKAKSAYHKPLVILYYVELMILIRRHVEDPYGGISSQSMQQVVRYMHEHFHEDIGIAALAERFGVGERMLRRMFAASLHVSPLQYLNRLRIEHAAELLAGTNLSVKEVCFRCGFNSPQHFSRLYKRITGHLPRKNR
ncbi:MAG: helix-turn-helix domain-containing protein [Muribaculaceae bacterium]